MKRRRELFAEQRKYGFYVLGGMAQANMAYMV